MAGSSATLDEVLTLARMLSAPERLRLIEELVAALEREWPGVESPPMRSLYGLWADLGPAPTADEIDQARREAWANFPREAMR